MIPKAKDVGEAQYSAKREYTYKNSSESNIHSLSLNIDQQNFLSSDDKGVYLWNLENANRPTQFTLIKQSALQNETVVSHAAFNQFGHA